jgi:transcriptional regulator with XRE-family HTH domain
MNIIVDINVLSDKAILQKIGLFVQQSRIKENLTQGDLAQQAAISRATLSMLERGENISLLNLIKILRILNALYVLNGFDEPEELSPLALAKGEKYRRQRASKVQAENSDLGW